MRPSRRQFLLASSALFFFAASHESNPALAERLRKKHQVPALSVAFIENGKITETFASGIRDTEQKLPAEASTVFEAASLSKPAFAYAVVRLCQDGKFTLDEPLLPHAPEPFCSDPRLAKITARMVFAHTSGLPHGIPDGQEVRLQSDPGSKFAYSATGFDYLQRAVAKISGQPVEEFMRERVFKPLKMARSEFIWTERLAPNLAKGYDPKGVGGETWIERFRKFSPERKTAIKKLHPEISDPPAAAALYTTASDYARFLIDILDPKYDDMCRPQIKIADKTAWSTGWGVLTDKKQEWIWHWGNWSGLFQHFTALNRATRRGLVLLTNSGNGLRLAKDFLPIALNLDLTPLKPFLD